MRLGAARLRGPSPLAQPLKKQAGGPCPCCPCSCPSPCTSAPAAAAAAAALAAALAAAAAEAGAEAALRRPLLRPVRRRRPLPPLRERAHHREAEQLLLLQSLLGGISRVATVATVLLGWLGWLGWHAG